MSPLPYRTGWQLSQSSRYQVFAWSNGERQSSEGKDWDKMYSTHVAFMPFVVGTRNQVINRDFARQIAVSQFHYIRLFK